MPLVNVVTKLSIMLVISSLLLSACSLSSSNKATALSNDEFTAADSARIVARVNGSIITAAELKRARKILLANKPGLQIPPTLEKEFDKQVLNQLVSTELLLQASKHVEIKDLDQQAKAKLAQIKRGFPDADGFARQLRNIGMDEDMFFESVRHELAIAYFINTRIAPTITVSEEEIRKFYEQNPGKFHRDEQIRVSHILIGADNKAGSEAKKAARDKAEKLHTDLVNGADFATLAKEHSADSSSKQGGDLGFFGKGKMVPQFEQAAFALQPGAISDVVETQFGFHIIKMVERKKAEDISLSEARNKIEGYLKAQKTNTAIEVFVGESRNKAKIDVLL